MPTALSLDELAKLIPTELISHGNAQLPEEDDGEGPEGEAGPEEEEVQEEEEVESPAEEAVLEPVLPVHDKEPEQKLAKSGSAWVKRVTALEAVVAEMREQMALYQNELDMLRGRTDRLQQESGDVRRQLGKQADGALQRQVDRLKNQMETYMQLRARR